MQTQVERIVNVLKGNGQSDAQNADLARRILAALDVEQVVDLTEVEQPFRLVAA